MMGAYVGPAGEFPACHAPQVFTDSTAAISHLSQQRDLALVLAARVEAWNDLATERVSNEF